MAKSAFTLTILTPQRQLFAGEVTAVEFPGTKSPFAVLRNHAPALSTLEKGVISWTSGASKEQLAIASGFVEIKNNNVVACVEVESK